ncbi:unnamed protein product [Alopecurus aequalis]
MGRLCRRSTARALLVIFLLSVVLAARCVVGSRSNWRPVSGSGGGGRSFGGYELPRAKLIPPSGPSERHNSVGPESTVPEQHLARKKP